MSDRHVTFQISAPAKSSSRSHRSREPGRDSGVGSSSSEQASLGGKPDRRFTAEDYHDQLYSVGALQEALGQANKKVEHYQKKCMDLDTELTKAHRALRDTEKLYREECERNERLERVNKDLESEKVAQDLQIQELKAAYNQMRDERNDYQQNYLNITEPVTDDTMRGASGEPTRIRRSGSKYDKDHKESKGASRKHIEYREEKGSSSRQHRRSSSVSVNPGSHLSSRKPYIEKMPPSPSSRYSGNYTTDLATTSMDPTPYSSIPRHAQSTYYHSVDDAPSSGNYLHYPLGEPRSYRRG